MFFSIIEGSGNNRSVSVGDKAVALLNAFRNKLPKATKTMPADKKHIPTIVTKFRSKGGELVPAKEKAYAITRRYTNGKVQTTSGDIW